MTQLEVSRGMPAVAEIVFEETARLQELGRWLPTQVSLPYDPEQTAEELLRTDRSRWRIDWADERHADRAAGWFEVTDVGPGGSNATVHLEMDEEDPAVGQLRQELEESMAGLYDLVMQRVNDAS